MDTPVDTTAVGVVPREGPMANAQEEDATRGRVKDLLAELTQVDLAKLVRQEELGEASFQTALPTFDRMLSLCREFGAAELDVVPYQSLKQIENYLNAAKATIAQAKALSIAQGNPVQARDNIVQTGRDVYDQYFPVVIPILNFMAGKKVDFAEYSAAARKEIDGLREFVQGQRSTQAGITAQMEETLKAVKTAAAEVGVGQQSVAFKTQADLHKSQSRWWLVAALAFALAAAWYTLYSLHWTEFEIPPTLQAYPAIALTRYALARLIVLSLLIYAVTFCARMFTANRHNEVVNRHRQNALQTFETFIKASKDEHAKDAVLLETTRSIFALQPSGYLKDEPSPPGSNTVIEILKKITEGGAHQ